MAASVKSRMSAPFPEAYNDLEKKGKEAKRKSELAVKNKGEEKETVRKPDIKIVPNGEPQKVVIKQNGIFTKPKELKI